MFAILVLSRLVTVITDIVCATHVRSQVCNDKHNAIKDCYCGLCELWLRCPSTPDSCTFGANRADCCVLCIYVYTAHMATPESILQAALAAPNKDALGPHLGTILALREKDYSWREIADFLGEHGVKAEHTKLFRLYTKHRSLAINVPNSETYKTGLSAIKVTEDQRAMLEFHYRAHNRTVTYTELARSAGYEDYRVANSHYGRLGKALGEAVGYTFPIAPDRGEPFYSASLGVDAPRTETREYRLMMHHELSKALDSLEWFK